MDAVLGDCLVSLNVEAPAEQAETRAAKDSRKDGTGAETTSSG